MNQSKINNFPDRNLKKHFGKCMIVVDDEDLVDFHDTEWFSEVEPELTPASNLSFYRKLEKMTQVELGEKLWVSKQVVSDMEHERRTISKKMAKELSRIFDVSVERFI